MIYEKLNAATSSNFYPLFLSELAPELNTKVVPNFIVELLAQFQPKQISNTGDNRQLQKLSFL